MAYFKNFPTAFYRFGDEATINRSIDISAYVDVVDQVKSNSAFYQKYYINEGDRPDVVSYKLYGTTRYYWTFFMMNDAIRLQGWPITSQQVLLKAHADYPNTVLTTRNNLTGIFKVGSTVMGQTSGATGTVLRRNLDLGQLFISTSDTFSSSEVIVEGDNSVNTVGASVEYNAVHHYENSDGETVDINPYAAPSVLYTAVTFYDRLIKANDDLKSIAVIRPENVNQINTAYQEALRSR